MFKRKKQPSSQAQADAKKDKKLQKKQDKLQQKEKKQQQRAQQPKGKQKPSAVTIQHLRSDFYRDGFQRLWMVAMLLIGSTAVCGFIIVYLWTHPPKDVYVRAYSQPAGKKHGAMNVPPYSLIKQPSLTIPFVTSSQLLIWANESAATLYSFNFLNYEDHFDDVRDLFTDPGWEKFQAGLKAAKIVESVIQNKYIVSARATMPPTLIQQGVVDDRFIWQVRVPLTVYYQNSLRSAVRQQFTVELIITRTPLSGDTPRGVAIAAFTVSQVQSFG